MRQSIRAFDSSASWCLNIMASLSLAAGSVSHLLLSYIPIGGYSHSWAVQTESRANMLMQWREKGIHLNTHTHTLVTAECV